MANFHYLQVVPQSQTSGFPMNPKHQPVVKKVKSCIFYINATL